MPVLRYFMFVGGALLALLLVCSAVFPEVPLPATLKSGSDLPAVRIHSERRWPERVVIDTTVPLPVQIAKADPSKAGTQKATVREAFARMETAGSKQASTPSAKAADNLAPTTVKVADASPPKAETKHQSRPQPKRRIARVRPPRPMMVAQQPQARFGFGWFDNTW
jgi:hypothetical protein